jgi:hypothetical protein
MKIQLTIELEIPDGQGSIEELRQNIFDDYINYAAVKHLSDATKWCGLVSTHPNPQVADIIWKHHRLWGKICSQPRWDLKVLDSAM